jgi:hypothetical protein
MKKTPDQHYLVETFIHHWTEKPSTTRRGRQIVDRAVVTATSREDAGILAALGQPPLYPRYARTIRPLSHTEWERLTSPLAGTRVLNANDVLSHAAIADEPDVVQTAVPGPS